MTLNEVLADNRVKDGSCYFRPLYYKGTGTALWLGPSKDIFYISDNPTREPKHWIANMQDFLVEWEICEISTVVDERKNKQMSLSEVLDERG